MPSRYLMQVVDRQTGEIVQFEPGQDVEIEFVEDCVANAVQHGVGFGRTSAQVATVLKQSIEEAIYALKLKVTP